jgi:Neuraminidase (sialidase)
VIADPSRPGYAYAVWRRGTYNLTERKQYISHTTDGGLTWSSPSAIPSSQLQLTGQLQVLPDGSLVDVYAQVPYPTTVGMRGPTTVFATRSTDLGVTWSPPVTVAVADPRTMTWVSTTVAPDGSLYASWQRADTRSFSILLTRSTDGGATWQKPTVVATEPGEPEFPGGENDGKILDAVGLAVASDGTLGVLFYDHRRDAVGTNPPRLTDVWLRTSRDGGRTWKEAHVAGPFDQTTAPSLATDMSFNPLPGRVAGGFIGDYQSLVPFAGGFAATFTQARTRAANEQQTDWFTNPTDIYFSHTT